MTDNIRPKKAVEVECNECEWSFWLDALDKSLPNGPFKCYSCKCNDRTFVPKELDNFVQKEEQ